MLNKPYLIFFLFLLVLPIVNASSFTGIFSDYGQDAGSDGLYDYLIINAQVNLNKSTNYGIYGRLEDNDGNFLEYTNCKFFNTGIRVYPVNFSGLKIYRNKANGPFNLRYIELSSMDNCTGGGLPPTVEHSSTNAYNTTAYLYTQFQRSEAAIYCNSSPCIASSALIKSKDKIDTLEPNSPNTLDGCEDGTEGAYKLTAESIENITLTSLNHSFFKSGDTVRADVSVYCTSPYDKLNLVYSAYEDNPQWTLKNISGCTPSGTRIISSSFKLSSNIGRHAARGIFGYSLQPSTLCGMNDLNKGWADTDDIVIQVKECSSNPDCSITECDKLDMCYNGTYRDYHNISNVCNSTTFACTAYSCTSYTEIITDSDNDGYDANCDNECNDSNANINPGAAEKCSNEIDDNCNGKTDSDDPECQGKYELKLRQGWNLFSFPKINNTNITEAIKIFNNSYEKILALKNGVWHIYDKSNLSKSNLERIEESDGFWVKSADNKSVMVEREHAYNVRFNLTKGWNIISYPSLEEGDINNLFNEVIDNIEIIYTYTNIDNKFNSFNPKRAASLIVKPGEGILIKIKNNAIWEFNNTYALNITKERFSLNLSNGWNFVSIPLSSEQEVSEIFGQKRIYYLENSRWKSIEGNSKLNYSYSYWINSSQPSLVVEGSEITSIEFNIKKGINTINYPLRQEKGIAQFFNNVTPDINLIMAFENSTWKTYNPLKPAELNSLTYLKPGSGIFVKAKADANWSFNGNEVVAT